jgi:hypothetical protein
MKAAYSVSLTNTIRKSQDRRDLVNFQMWVADVMYYSKDSDRLPNGEFPRTVRLARLMSQECATKLAEKLRGTAQQIKIVEIVADDDQYLPETLKELESPLDEPPGITSLKSAVEFCLKSMSASEVLTICKSEISGAARLRAAVQECSMDKRVKGEDILATVNHVVGEKYESGIHYFIFDLLICNDRDLTRLPLRERRDLMKSLLKLRSPRIRISEQFEASGNDMLAAVRQQQLEGVIGKRKDSLYEPGKRTGSWIKYRVNRGQEFVIGGYIPGRHGFDSLIIGYYRSKDLVYVARVRNGFVPASRRQVFEKIRPLVSPTMPFVNLPDSHKSRWGDELTAEKMKECVWLSCRIRHNNHHVGCRTMSKQSCELGSLLRSALIHSA